MSSEATSRRAATALIHSYAAHGFKGLLQVFVGVFLARLLGPEAFGLVAIAWVVVSISALVMDIGLSSSIIQVEKLSAPMVAYIFYVQLIVGLAMAALAFAAGPALASLLSAPAAGPLIQVMALTFVFKAMGQASFALLNRQLRFGELQLITVASYGLGFGAVAIGLAWMGCGAWSIVWAAIAQSAIASIAYLSLARPNLKLSSLAPPSHMLQFGFKTMGANLLSWIILNADALIIARLLGPMALGHYNRAMALANVPTVLVSSIQPLLFSNASRLQNTPDKIARAYLAATTAVALIMGPVLITASVVAHDVVTGLYGPTWTTAASLLAPLALAMIANAFTLLGGPLLMSINQTHREMIAQGLTVFAMLPAVGAAASHSLEAAAWAVFGVYLLRMLLITGSTLRALSVHISDYFRAFAPPLLIVAAPPAALAKATSAAAAGWAAEPRLGLVVCTAAIGYAITITICGPRLAAGPLSDLLMASERLPKAVARWMGVMSLRRG